MESSAVKLENKSGQRNSVGKDRIRKAARDLYDQAGNNAPNINHAWDSIKVLIPGAPRSRVREVLREPEFARRRRGPGRRATRRSDQPTTAQELPVAL
jgi:hypothetical protein